jgi:hypothetical protein
MNTRPFQRRNSERDALNGVLVYDDMPVATLNNGEVFLHSSGEKVAYVKRGFLYGINGELLASIEALTAEGQALSEREEKLLKL